MISKQQDPSKLGYLSLFKTPRFLLGFITLFILITLALLHTSLVPYDPLLTNPEKRLCSISTQHIFGCDLHGVDLFSLIISGCRTTFSIAFTALFISTTVGTFLGFISGYFRGYCDLIISTLTSIFMAFPGILLALSVAAFMGNSTLSVIVALSISSWTAPTRLIRGETLRLMTTDYVAASQALGANTSKIFFSHILPASFSPLIIFSTFSLSGLILTEASLSFLGLGPQNATESWGGLLNQGRSVLMEAPHLSLIPGFFIFWTILSLNLSGDALRDFFNPKSTP